MSCPTLPRVSKNSYMVSADENEHRLPSKVAKIKVTEMFDSPKHFLLQNELLSDTDDFFLDSDDGEDIRFYVKNFEPKVERSDTLFRGTPDLDFMMPTQVREILKSEGISSHVIDRTIQTGEKRHRLAQHLTFQQQKKCQRPIDNRKIGNKSVSLPKLTPTETSPRLTTSDNALCSDCSDCRDIQTRQRRRSTRTRPWLDIPTSSSMESSEPGSAHTKSPVPKREEVKFCLTESEQTQWLAEQESERQQVGSTFAHPRLVIVSSKIPKCHLLPKVLLEDEHVIYIVYDFDTWSFCDILDAVERKLSSIKKGCKAKSMLFLCQGGPGYLYILRKFVITPQKLRKDSYKNAREFWKLLCCHISKINQKEARLHIAGCSLGDGPQGCEVMKMLQRMIHPNMVYIENINEHIDQGQETISLYFNTRRYNLWRSKQEDSDDEIDFINDKEREMRTWSSIAAEFAEEPDVG